MLISFAQNAHDEDTKNQISRHIALALPRLMSKYAADGKKIAHILVLPQLINLSAYTDLRMSKVRYIAICFPNHKIINWANVMNIGI